MRRGGFSLIELVLVVAIVAIVTAIAVPRYAQALSRYRADAAANQLAAELERAVSRAKAGSASFDIEVDLQNETLSIIGPSPALTVVTLTEFAGDPYRVDLAVGASLRDGVTIDGFGRTNRVLIIDVISGDTKRVVTLSITGEVTAS